MTSSGHREDARVPDKLTASDREFSEARQPLGQVTEAIIRDIALAEVKRPEPGAAGGEAEEAGVCYRGAASSVEVTQLVTV